MSKMKASPHYSQLKDSVDYRFDRKQFWIFTGISLPILLPLLILVIVTLSRSESPNVAFGIMWCSFWGIAYLMLLAYFAYRWLEIFLHIDSYIFREVLLNQPHLVGRGGVKFTVTFPDSQGKQRTCDTGGMFSSGWEPYLEDYNNQTVLIAYNEVTDRVVVIQRIDR